MWVLDSFRTWRCTAERGTRYRAERQQKIGDPGWGSWYWEERKNTRKRSVWRGGVRKRAHKSRMGLKRKKREKKGLGWGFGAGRRQRGKGAPFGGGEKGSIKIREKTGIARNGNVTKRAKVFGQKNATPGVTLHTSLHKGRNRSKEVGSNSQTLTKNLLRQLGLRLEWRGPFGWWGWFTWPG